MDPFESYKLYNALKLHFETDGYDAFKYNFKTKVKPQSFFNRRDKYFFAKIGKNYGKDALTYYVANFKEGVSYVGDMVNEVGETNFKNHQKVAQSITRVFQDDINKLSEINETNFNGLFMSEEGQQPLIIQLWLQEEIHLETLVILDSILGFMQRESKNISDTLIWPDIQRKILKYAPFVNFDKDKCVNICKKGFTNT